MFTPDIVSTGVGGENQIRMIYSRDLPRLTSKRDDCCVLIDEYNTSADVHIYTYDSADVHVYKYNIPLNGTSPTTTKDVEWRKTEFCSLRLQEWMEKLQEWTKNPPMFRMVNTSGFDIPWESL